MLAAMKKDPKEDMNELKEVEHEKTGMANKVKKLSGYLNTKNAIIIKLVKQNYELKKQILSLKNEVENAEGVNGAVSSYLERKIKDHHNAMQERINYLLNEVERMKSKQEGCRKLDQDEVDSFVIINNNDGDASVPENHRNNKDIVLPASDNNKAFEESAAAMSDYGKPPLATAAAIAAAMVDNRKPLGTNINIKEELEDDIVPTAATIQEHSALVARVEPTTIICGKTVTHDRRGVKRGSSHGFLEENDDARKSRPRRKSNANQDYSEDVTDNYEISDSENSDLNRVENFKRVVRHKMKYNSSWFTKRSTEDPDEESLVI